MKNQIAAARIANSFLDRLCTDFETLYTDRLTSIRIAGRKILRGK